MAHPDKSVASLPNYQNVQIKCLGRQVNIRKATLGEKLRLMEIFSGWLGEMSAKTKGQKLSGSDMSLLANNLPSFMAKFRENYEEVLTISTDLKTPEIQQLTELKELVQILKVIWEINKFKEDLTGLGKVIGDLFGGLAAKNPTPDGSNP